MTHECMVGVCPSVILARYHHRPLSHFHGYTRSREGEGGGYNGIFLSSLPTSHKPLGIKNQRAHSQQNRAKGLDKGDDHSFVVCAYSAPHASN